MRLGYLAAAALMTCSCAAHRFECEKHGGKPAVRVDSEHFTVVSDLSAADTQFQVRRLERLWDAFAVFFQRAPTPGDRLQIVLSSDQSLSDEFHSGTAGFVTLGVSPLMVTTVAGEGAWSTNAHELVHFMSRHWLPNQPRWIAEGLAEFLGDAQFKSEYLLRFGRWQWKGGLVEPLLTLWAWGPGITPEEEQAHYQSAWAWIHYFANRDEARLAKLWAALAAGVAPRDAFDSLVPESEYEALREQVQGYVDEGRFSGWESKLLRDPELQAPVSVSPWEIHLLRRELAQATGWKAVARADAEKAREVAPSPEPPEVTLAIADETLSGPAFTDVVVKLPTSSFEVLMERGLAVDASPVFQLDSLKFAIKARPHSARAHLAFARVALRLDDEAALASAERAAELAPWSVEARLLQAQALAKKARCPEAWAALATAQSLAVERARSDSPRVLKTREKLTASCPEAP